MYTANYSLGDVVFRELVDGTLILVKITRMKSDKGKNILYGVIPFSKDGNKKYNFKNIDYVAEEELCSIGEILFGRHYV